MGSTSFNNSANTDFDAKNSHEHGELIWREAIFRQPHDDKGHAGLVHNLVGQGKTTQALEHAKTYMPLAASRKEFTPTYLFAVREHVKSIRNPGEIVRLLDDELAFVSGDNPLKEVCSKSLLHMRSEAEKARASLAVAHVSFN